MSNEPISDQYGRVAHEWAELNSAATILEEGKSSYLSRLIMAQGDLAHNRAETAVKASQVWADYIKNMVGARTAANHAKIDMEIIRMKMQEWVSADANNRARTKL